MGSIRKANILPAGGSIKVNAPKARVLEVVLMLNQTAGGRQ
jgi:hypothetical protein